MRWIEQAKLRFAPFEETCCQETRWLRSLLSVRGVPGITRVEASVTWEKAWGPERMVETVPAATPDVKDLAAEHGLERR